MSFLNPDKDEQSSRKIHVRSYTWSGGKTKPIDENNPEAGEKPYVEIKWYEGAGQSKTEGIYDGSFPIKLAVIGVTFQVTGYVGSKTPGAAVSYFSNETTKYGQELVLHMKDVRGFKEVGRGSFDKLKEQFGETIKSQYNVYFYDFERKCIDRFSFKGSSTSEWKEYRKQVRKNIYTGFTLLSQGEFKKFDVGKAIVPSFELRAPYTDAEREEIIPFAEQYEEYENNLANSSEQVPQDEYNQTPASYDGESSQELPDAPVEDNSDEAINLEDIPF